MYAWLVRVITFKGLNKGGTGKSTVVREVINNFRAAGKGFCGMFQWYSMHDPGAASIVHSYYGSGIADLSRGQLSAWLIGTLD